MADQAPVDGWYIAVDKPSDKHPSGRIYLAQFRGGRRVRVHKLDADEAFSVGRRLTSAADTLRGLAYGGNAPSSPIKHWRKNADQKWVG